MATVVRESIGTLHDKITVNLTKEDYMPAFEKALKQYSKNVQMPGFRKGMVPQGMIRKMYGQSVFTDEVIRTASGKLQDYMNEEKLSIFARPMGTDDSLPALDMNAPGDVAFSFEVGLKPEFEIPVLNQKTAITSYKIEVTDKMVEDELQRMTRRYGSVEDQEALSTDEDIMYAYYEAIGEDGAVLPGFEKKEDTVLFEKLPAGLKELVRGKKAGDSVEFVPAEVAEGDELNGFLKDPLKISADQANQKFRVTLTKVGKLIPHEINQELFDKAFPNNFITTEEQLKELLKTELQKEYDRVTRDRFDSEVFEMLVHQTPIELPVSFLKRWLREGQDKIRTEAEVEAEYPSFEHQLRWTLISDKLILENQIGVTREEVLDDVRTKVLAYFGMEGADEADWLESYITKVEKDENAINETYRRLLFEKLFNFLRTKFDVTEASISEEEFFKLQDAHAAHHHH